MRRRTNGTSRRRLIVVADLEEEVACQNTGTRGAREHLLTVDANREHISGKPERERVLSVQRGRAAKIRAPALSPNFFIKQCETAARILQLGQRVAITAAAHLG